MWRTAAIALCNYRWGGLAVLLGVIACQCQHGEGWAIADEAPPVTVRRPVARPDVRLPVPRQVPPPVSVIPGYPVPFEEGSILDNRTRFPTSGPAEARCPGQGVVFIAGVVNPYRPTQLGDGVFMCRGDAVSEGYMAR